jgi:flagellar capping protein FliD
MKLTKVAETIIAEDSGDLLWKLIAELEKDNDTLKHTVDLNAKDYNLVVVGNKKLAFEHNQLNLYSESLQAKMAQIRSDADKRITDLEAKTKFAETHVVEIAAEGDKILKDFKTGLVRKLRDYVRRMLRKFGLLEAYAHQCRWKSLRSKTM